MQFASYSSSVPAASRASARIALRANPYNGYPFPQGQPQTYAPQGYTPSAYAPDAEKGYGTPPANTTEHPAFPTANDGYAYVPPGVPAGRISPATGPTAAVTGYDAAPTTLPAAAHARALKQGLTPHRNALCHGMFSARYALIALLATLALGM
ncbi:hypothetical protein C8R44DRAFT_870645 [Mycena epipterygia]|nr:hypothetical protein C8R44DRAFT_870645 [Mycena epipterygia]